MEEKSANAPSAKKHEKYVAFEKKIQLLQGKDCIICYIKVSAYISVSSIVQVTVTNLLMVDKNMVQYLTAC
jgi:hypothetical protein